MPEDELQPKVKEYYSRNSLRLQEQKRYLLLGVIALLTITVFALSITLILNQTAAVPVAAGSSETPEAAGLATVLPQITRRNDSQNGNLGIITRDPFASMLKLTGIVTGGAGGSMAIVESGDNTYIVAAGEMIDGYWSVRKITPELVLLSSAEGEITLRLQDPVEDEPPGEAAEEVVK